MQLQAEDLWNDFAVLHQNQTTDLEIPGHRGYFGELLASNQKAKQPAQQASREGYAGECISL